MGDVYSDQVLWELSESFADVMQGPILAILKNDIQVFACFHKAFVLDDIGMLHNRFVVTRDI